MTKAELVDKLASEGGITKVQANKVRNRQKAGTVLIFLQDKERATPRRSHAEEETKTLPRRAVLRFRRENSAPLKIREPQGYHGALV